MVFSAAAKLIGLRSNTANPLHGHACSPDKRGVIVMDNTMILILIAILSVAGIFWLVIYSARRGQEHRERTTIKAPESRKQRPPAG